MSTKKGSPVVAVFRNIADAQAAAQELTANAFAGDHIHIVFEHPETSVSYDMAKNPRSGHREKDLATWFESMFDQDQRREREFYQNAIWRGNALLGVDTPQQMADTAMMILGHHSPVEVRKALSTKN